MSVPITYLAADFAVAPQLTPEQVRSLASHGFRSVVNNRLEQEPGQPPQQSLRDAAKDASLEYVWLPVHSGMITVEDVAKFAELLERLPRPVLAFCRSGTRSAILYRAAMSGAHLRAAP